MDRSEPPRLPARRSAPDHYRYHRLFSELLRERATSDASPTPLGSCTPEPARRQEQGTASGVAPRPSGEGQRPGRRARRGPDVPARASGRAARGAGVVGVVGRRGPARGGTDPDGARCVEYALLGLPAQTEVWAAAAERSTATVEPTDGSSLASMLAYMRAFLCRDGIEAMRADSIASYDGLSPTSPYRASMLFAEGLGHLLDDEPEQAEPTPRPLCRRRRGHRGRPRCGHGPDRARHDRCRPRDREATRRSATTAAGAASQGGATDEYWTAALVFAFGAAWRSTLTSSTWPGTGWHAAARLRPLLTYALPVVSTMACDRDDGRIRRDRAGGAAGARVRPAVRRRCRGQRRQPEDRAVRQPGDHPGRHRDDRGLGRLPEHPRSSAAGCRAPREIVVRALDRRGKPSR